MYIDLTYYKENGGEEISDAAFLRCAFRAEKIVDKFTFNRIKNIKETPEAVKRLLVELITLELTQGAAIKDNQAVSSFSNDGYAESVADPLTQERVKEIEKNLIYEYLSEETDDIGTPLLYLGVS